MGTNGDTCSVGDAVEVASDGGFWVARLTSLKLQQRKCTVCWFYSQGGVKAAAPPWAAMQLSGRARHAWIFLAFGQSCHVGAPTSAVVVLRWRTRAVANFRHRYSQTLLQTAFVAPAHIGSIPHLRHHVTETRRSNISARKKFVLLSVWLPHADVRTSTHVLAPRTKHKTGTAKGIRRDYAIIFARGNRYSFRPRQSVHQVTLRAQQISRQLCERFLLH